MTLEEMQPVGNSSKIKRNKSCSVTDLSSNRGLRREMNSLLNLYIKGIKGEAMDKPRYDRRIIKIDIFSLSSFLCAREIMLARKITRARDQS